jgi:hypothetical protein
MGMSNGKGIPKDLHQRRMRSSVVFLLALLTAVVNAHFDLQFPPPRGLLDEDNEDKFCGSLSLSKTINFFFKEKHSLFIDGYMTPTSNRTQFPLKGGYITMSLEHSESWAGKTSTQLYTTSAHNLFIFSWNIYFNLYESYQIPRLCFNQ